MTLRGLMNRHARAILGNTTGGFAEPVVYRFHSGDPDRTFAAVVKRLDLQASTPLSGKVAKRRARVEIPRHATAGVLQVAKGDSIVLPIRVGDEATECLIVSVPAQDDALFVVEVEA